MMLSNIHADQIMMNVQRGYTEWKLALDNEEYDPKPNGDN